MVTHATKSFMNTATVIIIILESVDSSSKQRLDTAMPSSIPVLEKGSTRSSRRGSYGIYIRNQYSKANNNSVEYACVRDQFLQTYTVIPERGTNPFTSILQNPISGEMDEPSANKIDFTCPSAPLAPPFPSFLASRAGPRRRPRHGFRRSRAVFAQCGEDAFEPGDVRQFLALPGRRHTRVVLDRPVPHVKHCKRE